MASRGSRKRKDRPRSRPRPTSETLRAERDAAYSLLRELVARTEGSVVIHDVFEVVERAKRLLATAEQPAKGEGEHR